MEDAGVDEFQTEEEVAFQLVDQHRKVDGVGIHEMHCRWWVVVGMDGHWHEGGAGQGAVAVAPERKE